MRDLIVNCEFGAVDKIIGLIPHGCRLGQIRWAEHCAILTISVPDDLWEHKTNLAKIEIADSGLTRTASIVPDFNLR